MTTTTTSPIEVAATAAPEKTMTILIADKFDPTGIEDLQATGAIVVSEPDLDADSLPAAIAKHNPEVLIVRSTKVTGAAFEAADLLNLVVRAGAGYNTIDVKAASDRGIFIANCPAKNAIAVAELAFGLICACDRRIPDQTADLRSGDWNKKEYGVARGLKGRTIGIVGMGAIGREVATRAKSFGMKVVAWSRSLDEQTADELGVGYCSSVINLAKMSDIITIHCAATPETENMVDEAFIAAMKDGAYLINTSRGSLVDEAALAKGVRDKGIRAGLDVFADEPGASTGAFSNDLISLAGVYGTHHVGASTDQAQSAIAAEAVRIVQTYQKTGDAPNCVNRAASTPATTLLTVRHRNRPGVLAHVFYTLGQSHINVEEMENIIYEGAEAACARIQLDAPPEPAHLAAIKHNEDVLSVSIANIRK